MGVAGGGPPPPPDIGDDQVVVNGQRRSCRVVEHGDVEVLPPSWPCAGCDLEGLCEHAEREADEPGSRLDRTVCFHWVDVYFLRTDSTDNLTARLTG